METKVFTIISTAANSRKQINSTATTLRELKADLRANGINYEGMSFMEGLTHTMMVDDDAVLPTNVKYKDTVTNNLVFMLTNSSKRIKSGSDRAELYSYIRSHNLSKAIADKYGKNFTQCTSEELQQFIDSYERVSESEATPLDNVKEAFAILLNALYCDGLIDCDTKENVEATLAQKEHVAPVYSDDDLAEITSGFDAPDYNC